MPGTWWLRGWEREDDGVGRGGRDGNREPKKRTNYESKMWCKRPTRLSASMA